MHPNATSGRPSSPPRLVALTGFMAAGKSTVARTLASLRHWQLVDLDCEIEGNCKLRVHEIFLSQGEAHFRRIETEMLRSVLEHAAAATVIALGGGTFIQPENVTLLRKHGVQVVFLELGVNVLLQRCRALSERCGQNPRPLAADPEAFRALYRQRLPLYRNADLTVNAQAKTAEQVAREIIAALDLAGHPAK